MSVTWKESDVHSDLRIAEGLPENEENRSEYVKSQRIKVRTLNQNLGLIEVKKKKGAKRGRNVHPNRYRIVDTGDALYVATSDEAAETVGATSSNVAESDFGF